MRIGGEAGAHCAEPKLESAAGVAPGRRDYVLTLMMTVAFGREQRYERQYLEFASETNSAVASRHRRGQSMRTAVLVRWSVAALLVVAGSTRGIAHHSFAMFDTANPIELTGIVTAFQWTNPHVYIELDVPEARGGVRHWTIELGSPSILMRANWKFNTLKKGDKVTAVVSPLKSGEPGSLLSWITLSDGQVLGNGGARGVGPGTTQR
jgi:hypothetical protein